MKNEKNVNENQTKQKLSNFQIASFMLVLILVVAVIVQIGIIIGLKNKTDDLKKKLETLPPQQEETAPTTTQNFENVVLKWNF